MDIPEYPEAPLGEGRDFYLHQLRMQSYYIFSDMCKSASDFGRFFVSVISRSSLGR